MKRKIHISVILYIIFTSLLTAQSKTKSYSMTTFSDKGNPAPKEYFTGTVWVNPHSGKDDDYNTTIGTVTFKPKARTNWHTHTTGQILLVIEGTGYYQEKGKPIQLIQKGDVIKIPKNTLHWHGASHNSSMRHIAIVPELDKDTTEWLQPVNNEEYNSFKAPVYEVENHISPKAIMNHEELWPNHVSKAKETDPDLVEVFDNFAFDEVLTQNAMDTRTRVMMIMASTIGSHALTEYKMYLNAALNTGVSPIEIKEILYQSVPYVGISKVTDFIQVTNEVFTEHDIQLPLESQSVTTPANRAEKGLALQKGIFGNGIDDMYKNSPDDLLHIQKFLSANCFGDYVTRSGLDIKTREMVTLSFLIALGGTESQIKGHIRGNSNVGNDRQALIDLITNLLPYVGYPRTLNAINCLNEILPPSK